MHIKGQTSDLVLEGDTADQIQQHCEEEVYEYIMKMPEGAIFFDLGASIGNFSLFSAAHGLKTYAFEPDPKNFEVLELNRRANAFTDLRTFEIAISDGVNPQGVLMSNSKKQRRTLVGKPVSVQHFTHALQEPVLVADVGPADEKLGCVEAEDLGVAEIADHETDA